MAPVILAAVLIGPALGNPDAEFAWKGLARTPEARIEDAYKWIFQAELGGEHAIADLDEAKVWLDSEWKGLGSALPNEPSTVSLRQDGRLVRANLRPYKAGGGTERTMLTAFVRSAKLFRHDKSTFISVWRRFGRLLSHRPLPHIGEADWLRMDRQMRPRYPFDDHSAEYERTYKPAYRVLLRSEWLKISRKGSH